MPIASLITDLCYAVFAIATAPIWLVRMAWRGKLRTDWPARFGRGDSIVRTKRPRVMIHAVSVGEVNAIRGLVERLAADRMQPEIVVSVTTDTGIARARALFGDRHMVVRTPFDFSFAVRRWLDRTRPDVLVLVELELWPNTTRICAGRGVPVVVANGRLSDRSVKRYRMVRALVAPMFARAELVLAQNKTYAERFAELGAREVLVSGNMKWDSIAIRETVPGVEKLMSEMGVPLGSAVLVAGSTEPGEELLLRDALPPGVRLVIAPRKPEWWDGVAANLPGCVRRSRNERGTPETRFFVLDTIGELSMAYAMADVIVMGRSFGRLYGSDPIEPASLGRPVIIGPRVADFREVVALLKEGGGLLQIEAGELKATLGELFESADRRAEIARNARAVIRREQGGTARTAEVILAMLASRA